MQREITLSQIYDEVTDLSSAVDAFEDALQTARDLEDAAKDHLSRAEFNTNYLQVVYRRRLREESTSDAFSSRMETLSQLKSIVDSCKERIAAASLSEEDRPATPRR